MARLSHSTVRLSIGLFAAAGLAAISATALTAAADPRSPYFGRWTMNDRYSAYNGYSAFSSYGRPYRTIDLAPCGRDLCGAGVDRTGKCGAVLFRIPVQSGSKNPLGGTGAWPARGSGLWGNQRKTIALQMSIGSRELVINLGDEYSFAERSGSGPKLVAAYSPAGAARCIAR